MVHEGSGLQTLNQSIRDTYFSLRWGIVVVAIAIPFVLWIGGAVFYKLPLWPPCDSLSAYYATGMRDWFVGFLFAVGASLYLYKGTSGRENYLLNFAGAFAIVVAVSPFTWHPQGWPKHVTPHGLFAVSFFIMIVLDCWLCQDDSFQLGLISQEQRARYHRTYTLLGIALLALPALAALINTGLLGNRFSSSVFWIESTTIWVFAIYWAIKSGELEQSFRKRLEATPDARAGEVLRESRN